MLKALAIIFLIILIIRMILGSFLKGIFRFLGADINVSRAKPGNRQKRDNQQQPDDSSVTGVKKFSKEVGDYVSYEEVKDEE